jgi:hypothetical protein
MNTAAILRALADMIDKHSAPQPQEPQQTTAVLAPQPQEPTPEPESNKFFPPLQQKMELLKKAVGVPSEFDNDCGCDDDATQEPDEIAIMRKNAGMNPVAVIQSEEDEDTAV